MRRCSSRISRQAGLTLIELVIAIVVLGIAAVAILQSLGVQVLANVDPMLRSQSRLLAEATLNEIQTKAFFDSDDDPVLNPGSLPTDVCPTPETLTADDRTTWDNICDYHGYDSGTDGPRYRDGSLMPGLSGYRVQAAVNAGFGLALGSGLSNQAGCVPQVARITVTVTDPRNQPLTLDAYRTSYFDDPGVGC
ncbi:type IV pilus modification PilV family protein [Saccharospirillum mangrovi]|uniref:type IV pilus modification PilV family protein n=1 Tax=Saccharospirillum mangrovi TaxID=2161747 RepID=UPI000D34E909|nr:prepilin-type N-terminal cleavage/methylation domain-containing protein [Saccharospirillum mangrovi]